MSSDLKDPLTLPIKELHGVGRERAGQLARLELHAVRDLLFHRPRRYEDRERVLGIKELQEGETAGTRGKIVALGVKRYSKGTKSVFELILDDGTGRLHCRWWNLPYMQNYFKPGEELFVYGKVKSLRPRTIDHPETEVIDGGEEASIHLNRIVPIYPLTEGLSQRWVRTLIWNTLADYGHLVPETNPDLQGWPSRMEAVRMLHAPMTLPESELGRRRLALDEFVQLQITIQTRKKNLLRLAVSRPCAGNNALIKPFLSGLEFKLTEAQKRVLRDMRQDLGSGKPMRRLLQGDVGSGKTVVAACGALMTIESGYNVLLMAPTEILAEQHYRTFRHWLEPFEINVLLRTGSHKASGSTVEPLLPLDGLERKRLNLVIGTHALIEDAFTLENPGLVIIDEQHKFGVAQREKLVRKGQYPHLLVMTATPIPRTLSLTLYGDLDISIIDELPSGRKPIRTFVRTAEDLPRIWDFVRKQLGQGRQAYMVYPRIESEDKGAKAVTKEWEKLRATFHPHQAALLHGGMAAEEKERVMTAFRMNQVQVLMATQVIEVGVDVPNATLMIIENAEQFGLAQLHQLRGRIGRGEHESYCILVAGAITKEGRQRLRILEKSTDGFRIAEEDLRLRGPGDLAGWQQSGMPPLQFGDLVEDGELMELAKKKVAERMG
jgi:ATP-dependent DNA helicase RecG